VKRVLVRDDKPVPLAPKVAEILLVLVENAVTWWTKTT
jgi:hypothetical protein